MNKNYYKGFYKTAAAHGVDPELLANYTLGQTKYAQEASGVWAKVLQALNKAKDKYDRLSPTAQTLIGAGAGGLIGGGLGAGVGAIANGKKGAGWGALIGALSGAGVGAGAGYANKRLKKAIGELGKQRQAAKTEELTPEDIERIETMSGQAANQREDEELNGDGGFTPGSVEWARYKRDQFLKDNK